MSTEPSLVDGESADNGASTGTQVVDPMADQVPSDSGLPSTEYINSITRHDLPSSSVEQLKVLLTKDYILSNLTSAAIWEIKWLARVDAKRILTQHPHPDCIYPPEYMAEVYDVEVENCYEALTDPQRQEFLQVAELIYIRAARSKGGWQQDEISKSLNVSRVEHEGESKTSRRDKLWSIFS